MQSKFRKASRIITTHLIWVVSFSLSTTLLAQNTKTYTLYGSVVDRATGVPIVAANIQVVDHPLGAAARTDGKFTIEDLAKGEYTLLVSAIDFESRRIGVSIPVSGALKVQLKETFFQMGSVVVTGTRTEKIHLNTPVATEVITSQDVEDSGARDLGELLEQRSGVSVSSSVEGGAIVNVLGMDSKYVMLLVDGQPVTGKFNNRIMLDQIPVASIEKVEVVKGPGSALYGSEAMGGVINVVTKQEAQESPLSLRLRHSDRMAVYNPANLGSGQRNLLLAYSRHGHKYGFNLDSDVLLANVDKSIQHIDVDQFNTFNLGGSFRFNPSEKHSFKYQGSQYLNREVGSADLLDSETAIHRSNNNLIYSWTPGSPIDLQLSAHSAGYDRDYLQTRPWGDTLRDEHTTEEQIEFEALANISWSSSTLTLGSEFGNHRYISERVSGGQRDVQQTALFFQLEISPLSKWTLVLGTRYDESSDFSAVTSPRLAVMFQPGNRWRLRASAGTGYRKPSFMDRFIDWNHQQFGYRIEGNPDLEPERSAGVSLGVDYYHPAQYQASLFMYQNRFTNMIVDALLQPGLFTYVNVEQVNYSGLELQVRWRVSSRLLSSWGYTFSLNRNAETGELIPNLPIHSANFRVTFKQTDDRWSASAKVKAVNGYTVDEFIVLTQQLERSQRSGYIMLDLDAHHQLWSWMSVSAGIKNALDVTDDRYGPFFGRTLYLEIESKLKGS